MSITVTNAYDDKVSCQSQVQAHDDAPAEAAIYLGIGSHEGIPLCIDCARKTFNLVGFMIMSATGESLQALVGLRKGRK